MKKRITLLKLRSEGSVCLLKNKDLLKLALLFTDLVSVVECEVLEFDKSSLEGLIFNSVPFKAFCKEQ